MIIYYIQNCYYESFKILINSRQHKKNINTRYKNKFKKTNKTIKRSSNRIRSSI